MSTKHMPGPIAAERASSTGDAWELLDDETLSVTVARCTGPRAEANAKRIEALWNAYEQPGGLPPSDVIETLAEKMANADCSEGEALWPHLAESDRRHWRAAARVAVSELAAIAKATA